MSSLAVDRLDMAAFTLAPVPALLLLSIERERRVPRLRSTSPRLAAVDERYWHRDIPATVDIIPSEM
jgi:hypothetical protein